MKTEALYGIQRKIPLKVNCKESSVSWGVEMNSSFLTAKESTSLKNPHTFRDVLALPTLGSPEHSWHIFGVGETITLVFCSNMPHDTLESKLSKTKKLL